MIERALGSGVVFEADPATGLVVTHYPDGYEARATRADTPENREQAAEQGYKGNAAVWQSVVEHELAHTLVARLIFCRESLVLRFECGAEQTRYALRLHEEALCLSLQYWLNTRAIDPVWFRYGELLAGLTRQIRDYSSN